MRNNEKALLEEGLEDLRQVLCARAALAARAKEKGITVREYLSDPIRRAKRLAKQIGLAYWPAIAYGPRIDPWAYVVAERIISGDNGPRWGEIVDGRRSHGGWDSYGHHGVAAADVADWWYAAGCRDSSKFRLQVKNYVSLKKGDTLPFARAYVRGGALGIFQCPVRLRRNHVPFEQKGHSRPRAAILALPLGGPPRGHPEQEADQDQEPQLGGRQGRPKGVLVGDQLYAARRG